MPDSKQPDGRDRARLEQLHRDAATEQIVLTLDQYEMEDIADGQWGDEAAEAVVKDLERAGFKIVKVTP